MGRRIAAVAVVVGLALGASAREVVVGIAETCPTNRRVEVCSAYATSVYAAGAIPFVLPATTNAEVIAAMLDRIDLLLLPETAAQSSGGCISVKCTSEVSADGGCAFHGNAPTYGTAPACGNAPTCGTAPMTGEAWRAALVEGAKARRVPVVGERGRLKEGLAKVGPRPDRPHARKLVLVPDYCTTNGMTTCYANLAAVIERAGFVSFVLPYTTNTNRLVAAVAEGDAMMFGGGMDGQDYKRRCSFEYLVLAPAVKRGMPIAGICHGLQHINVFLGGKLEPTRQKKGEVAPDVVVHTHKDHPVFHEAEFAPGSRIARAMGAAKCRVNSWHTLHSAKLGKGLKVTARAPDGVVEAFEHEALPIMAFQFHPELMADDPRFVGLVREALSNLKEKSK